MKLKHLYFCLVLLAISCATNKKIENPENIIPPTETDDHLVERIFLIGNPVEPSSDATQQTFNSLKKELTIAEENSTVVFLGNYFQKPEKGHTLSKEEIENQLRPLVQVVDDYKGKVLFIPGTNDWKVNGLKGLKQQQKYIEKALGDKSYLPDGACPIKKIDINDDVVMIVVDGTWFVENWDNYPEINADCDCNTRQRFYLAFENEIKKARGKTTLVAMSRPIVDNGEHGGHYTAKSNLLPLPILGNVKNILRTASGLNKDDISNKSYFDLVQRMSTLARQNNNVIFLSAHENNMQFVIASEALPQIITGSASKIAPAKRMKNTVYSEGAYGYAVLNIYENGASDIDFVNTDTGKVTFSGAIREENPNYDESYPKITEEYVPAAIFSNKEAHKGPIYRFLVGNRYRKYYGTDLMTNPAYIDTLYGGLTPIREGGGHQSISLHLKDKIGQQYVIRAFKKNSAQYLQAVSFRDFYMQPQLEHSALTNLVEDYFTGSYPYAILLAEQLSYPIKIPTLDTKIIYLPKQDALGRYNERSGDKISMIEKHPKKGKYQLGVVNFEGEVIDTYEMLHNIEKSHKNQIDQKAFLKARLFDMLIGDWDRHYKQWKWLTYDEDGKEIYRPLPLDRDQAFSKMGDGFLTKVALFLVPSIRLIVNYSGKLRDVKYFNDEPFRLDSNFLPDMTLQDWIDQAANIQNSLPDEYIDKVFENMPPELKGKDLDLIKGHLKERRNRLQDIAKRYYRYVYQFAKIMGTNQDDYFKIEVLPSKEVEVSVYHMKDGEIGARYHHKIYDPNITKQLWIYGFDDNDTYDVIGENSVIKLILAGGPKEDKYIVPNRNRVQIYDFKSGKNDLTEAKKTGKHLMDYYDLNSFDYEKNYLNNFQVLPLINANQDVGTEFIFKMMNSQERFVGTSKQNLDFHYYSATSGIVLNYKLKLPNVIKRLDFNLNVNYNSQNHTNNFFGWGNESINKQDSLNRDYNRVNNTGYDIKADLSRGTFSGFGFVLQGEWLNMKTYKDATGISANPALFPDYIFNTNNYLGLNGSISFNNLDNAGFPRNGMDANISFSYQNNIDVPAKSVFKLSSNMNIDYNLSQNARFVLATRLTGSYIFGNEFEYFQGATIGGNSGLRGYRNDRYSGRASFSQSTDLRYNFRRMHTFLLPMSFGFYGGLDYGRVWVDDDPSRKLHYSYGGGLFIDFVESASANLGAFNSEEGFQVFFKMGFGF